MFLERLLRRGYGTTFVFGQSATPGASSGGGGAVGELESKKTYAASPFRRPPDGGRTALVQGE